MTANPLEAEAAVIGAILIDARCSGEVAQLLQPEDFALEINRGLYQAVLKLERQNKPIDAVTVRDEALSMGVQVSDQYILQLMDVTPTAANVSEYAKIARDGALRRRLRSILEQTQDVLAAGAEPPHDVLAQMLRSLDAVQQDGMTDDLLTPDDAMLAFYTHRGNVESGRRSGCLRTGYQDLDNLLGGGLLASGMYVLAARPGMGKTTFAVNIADRLARGGVPVLFVSLEMDPEQLDAKRISRETGIPASRLLMSVLDPEEQTKVAEAADLLRSYPVYLNRRPSVTVGQIESMARRIKGLGLIVIDYIGKITPDDPRRSRYEYTTEISGGIKTMARRFRVPVLALCQLNRNAAARSDPTPTLSDLRDTGAVEQDADGVIFLHRKDYFGKKNDEQKRDERKCETADLQVIVDKNRHGPVGACSLVFDMRSSKMITSRTMPTVSAEVPKPRQKPRQESFWKGLSPWETENEGSADE